MSTRILCDKNVPIPMRDGVRLIADIYRPDVSTPCACILCRIPYNKDNTLLQLEAVPPLRAAEAGYAIVFQDTRGRYRSEGTFYPFVSEGQDGYDTIEWIAQQPWCNGEIGMVGASYFGATQWLAAIQQPPHLKAIVPIVTSSEYYEGWCYQGGAFQLGFLLLWTIQGLIPDTAARQAANPQDTFEIFSRYLAATDDMDLFYKGLPLSSLDLIKDLAPYYKDWLSHEQPDAYWQSIAINRNYSRIHTPAYNIGAWFDLFLKGTLENYVQMRQRGGSPEARRRQRMLIAPWAHGNFSASFSEASFGYLASADGLDLAGEALRFFDHHLKKQPSDLDLDHPVRIFVMGQNRWREETDWPVLGTQYVPWYLHSSGNAALNGGSLSPFSPTEEHPDAYLYDPRNPVPTWGGGTFLPGMRLGTNAGPRDQQPVEKRQDVLVYTSEPLQEPLEVTGPLLVRLWASSSAKDTDFVARLCDVGPDGSSRLLAEGILRARFRDGFQTPKWLEPGNIYAFEIDLVATSNVFLPGHRIRIDVTSSSFPRFNANPNTAVPLADYTAADQTPALQTVYHTSSCPSHILLPLPQR